MCVIKLWNRILSMPESRLTRKVLLWDHRHNKQRTWCGDVKQIMSQTGFLDVFNDMRICDNDVLKCIHTKLMNSYIDEWKKDLYNQPKLRTYRQFKMEYQTEPYVKMCMSRCNRSFLAQFRSGVLPLHIETGRFVGKKPDERICHFCKNTPETEEHFLLNCPVYLSLRLVWMQNLGQSDNYNVSNSSFKDLLVMIFNDHRMIKHTANFIRLSYASRCDKLYKNGFNNIF